MPRPSCSSCLVDLIVGTDAVLYVNLENPFGAASDLLREMVTLETKHRGLRPGAPSAIARAIRAVLLGSSDPALPEWVFFSAILATSARVEVCLA